MIEMKRLNAFHVLTLTINFLIWRKDKMCAEKNIPTLLYVSSINIGIHMHIGMPVINIWTIYLKEFHFQNWYSFVTNY